MAELTLIQGIARMEGFLVAGSRAQRNKNPGNLNYEPWLAHAFGAVLETPIKGEVARFANFPSDEAGYNALKTLLLKDYLGLTLAQAIAKFAPSTENNTLQYVSALVEWTGLASGTVLTSINIG